MHTFAKLYWSEELGQVLIVKGDHSVTIRFLHPSGGELCALKSDLPDSEIGREKAAELFSMLDEGFAMQVVRDLINDKDFDKISSLAKGSMDA
jgi:hypothetical protein